MADEIDARIRARSGRSTPSTGWSEADAWMIAYPDMFGSAGLGAVCEVMDELAPDINGVHVLPFHPSSSDGGFAVMDYDVVDPAVGGWADVEALAARHRLMADAVVNHVSAGGVWADQWRSGDARRAGFFRPVEEGDDLGSVARPRPGPPTASVTRRGEVVDVWATFGPDQLDLDYRTPAVLLAVIDAVLGYVDRGAAAIRLDAVAYLWKVPGGPSIHEPETHAIVALLRSVLDEIDPGLVLVTETNVPHDDNVAYFGSSAEPEADAVYQFTLAPLALHAAQTGDTAPLVRWLRTVAAPAGGTFLNFLASHDGVGLRPARGWLSAAQVAAMAERCRAVGGGVNEAATPDGSEPYELTATWFALCGAGVDARTAAARHDATHAVMLALTGVPLLYAHSLAHAGNDVARATASGLGRDLNRGRYGDRAEYLGRVESRGDAIRSWIARRRRDPAFHPDSPQRVLDAPDGVVAVERGADPASVRVVVNLRGAPVTGQIDGETMALEPYAVVWPATVSGS